MFPHLERFTFDIEKRLFDLCNLLSSSPGRPLKVLLRNPPEFFLLVFGDHSFSFFPGASIQRVAWIPLAKL